MYGGEGDQTDPVRNPVEDRQCIAFGCPDPDATLLGGGGLVRILHRRALLVPEVPSSWLATVGFQRQLIESGYRSRRQRSFPFRPLCRGQQPNVELSRLFSLRTQLLSAVCPNGPSWLGESATLAHFPLKRFARCGRCGRSLTGSYATGRGGKKYPYYHCPRL